MFGGDRFEFHRLTLLLVISVFVYWQKRIQTSNIPITNTPITKLIVEVYSKRSISFDYFLIIKSTTN